MDQSSQNKIAVGQIWRNANGESVTIETFDNDDLKYPWGDDGGRWYDQHGHIAGTKKLGLVTLVTDVPAPLVIGDSHQALTFHRLDPTDPAYAVAAGGPMGMAAAVALASAAAANDGNVGDIKSDAKGSGARFNAGKPPFELIPFGILARYYRQSVVGKDAEIDALEFLGKFQARDGADNLMKAAISLGGGWDECAKVFDYGRIKYAENNWTKGMRWSVPMACAARHLIAMILGEENDAESGLPHRGHFLCNVVMLATFEKTYAEGDNRAPAGRFLPSAAAA